MFADCILPVVMKWKLQWRQQSTEEQMMKKAMQLFSSRDCRQPIDLDVFYAV